MPLKKNFTYFKKVKKLAIWRKIMVKGDILIENIFVLLEDKLIKHS